MWCSEPKPEPFWQVDVTPAGELFPALDLSQAPAAEAGDTGGGNGLVGVRLRGDDLPRRLRLEIETPGLAQPAVLEYERAAEGPVATLDLHPRLDWDVAALRTLDHVRSQRLRVTLEADGRREVREALANLHPLHEAA